MVLQHFFPYPFLLVPNFIYHQNMGAYTSANDSCKRPFWLAFESSSTSSAAVVHNVSKPFWMARQPMATARWVFPRPVLPYKDQRAPFRNPAQNGNRAGTGVVSSRLKSNSSMGKWGALVT